MIHIRYSNRVESLAAALSELLPPPDDIAALFDGPWLLVPSRPLGLYLDLELARRRNISGHLDTLSPEGAFARLSVRAHPDLVLIERGHIVGELMATLADDALRDDAALAPLQRYLLAAGSGVHAVERRRVEVARALAALFDEWAVTKPERIAAWRAGDVNPATAHHPLGRAEHALWVELFGPRGRFARRAAAERRRYLTLADVLAQGLDEAWQPPSAVHAFGLSELSRGTQLALARLGQRTDLYIYAVNPCREFWEDVSTRRRGNPPASAARRRRTGARRATADDRQLAFATLDRTRATSDADAARSESAAGPIPSEVPADNPFLIAWGHAGRESTRLLNQLSDNDFDPLFVDPRDGRALDASTPADAEVAAPPTRGSLLGRVQNDILRRRAPDPIADRLDGAGDGSIALLRAPNPRRALESIAAEIWSLVGARDGGPAATAPLRFSDIAVLIAGDDEPYLSLARAVFREARELPHAIVDQPLGATSHLIEAVLGLLALPLGAFTRREVLDVITHPNVRARFPDADPEIWLKLCEGLAITRGCDRAALDGTYIEGDVFNWDQGLKRLALGLFARGPRSGADDAIPLPVTSGDGPPAKPTSYVPAEVSADVAPDAQAFALLVRSLLADAAFARTARLTVPDWMRFVRALLAAYVVPVHTDDESARLRVFAALDQLSAQAPSDLVVGLSTVLELMRGALTGLRGTRGQMLGSGVAVGTLAVLRGVPFRVIFVVGLDNERFPARDRPSPFEIDPGETRPGDLTARQRDRYLFLEALLAARERLLLSYIDRDALTGEPREPSAVVLDLQQGLKLGYLREDARIDRVLPLHRDEDPALFAALAGAASEARARDVGAALRGAIPEVGAWNASAIVRAMSPSVRRALAPDLRTVELADQAGPARTRATRDEKPTDDRRILRLIDLRRFLECPLQGSARVFLGLRDLPDDTDAREAGDEPFDVAPWLHRGLLGEVMALAWSEQSGIPAREAIEAAYDAVVERARARPDRLFPEGLFRDNVRRRHLQSLETWREALMSDPSVAGSVRGPVRRVCFGRPDPFAATAERRPPLILTIPRSDAPPLTVELHGTTEPQVQVGVQPGVQPGEHGASLLLATSTISENDHKDGLRAFIDHVALAASRSVDAAPTPWGTVIVRPNKDRKSGLASTSRFRPLTAERARAYLTALSSELLTGVHSYLFPCDAVFRSWDGRSTVTERIDEIRVDTWYQRVCSSLNGPVPDALTYPTPSAQEAARYLEARFGLFRELVPTTEGAAGRRSPPA